MAQYETLSKFRIAEIQLEQALNLYAEGRDLISSITLAGAAEEILGRLVEQNGEVWALTEKVAQLCGMYQFTWGKEADPKAFIAIRNQARNNLKHITTGDETSLDLEIEAVSMLRRAIKNYLKLAPSAKFKFRVFEKEYLRRWRERQHEYAAQDICPGA